ncbi:hypothetical protein [Xylophilus sp.]|uniref:hypothetical protein n=1 Tax=Xylophilus sp. TaxID=2653893 RepID=UPI002D7E65F2|nr:hypothetical protein [Xylophilus sp.]
MAVWPSYEPLTGIWHMQELAVGKTGNPKWRDRQIPSAGGGIKMDWYRDADTALAARLELNARYEADLKVSPIDEEVRHSLQLKASKSLQAKERLQSEEALMLADARRRKASVPAPSAAELKLTARAEPLRDALADALAEFPYVTGVRVGELHERLAMAKSYSGIWDLLADGSLHKRGATLIERSKIASGFDLNPTEHWGEVKAKIRTILLPRANQLLQLSSVRRLLDEALARGEKALVCNGVVFWYEPDGNVGWQVKSTDTVKSGEGTTLWAEGTIRFRKSRPVGNPPIH